MSTKKKYQVKDGFRFGALNEYEAGDVVELTEAQAAGFLDKLRPYSEKVKQSASESGEEGSEEGSKEGGKLITNPADVIFTTLVAKSRDALKGAGLDTDEKVQAASDDDLAAAGLSAAAIKNVREAYVAK